MRMAWWWALPGALLALAAAAGEQWSLRLAVDAAPGDVRVVAAERGDFAPAHPVAAVPGRTLHVTGRDAGGSVLFDFHVRDPRQMRAEAFDPVTGHIVTARDVVMRAASMDLRVPALPQLATLTVRGDALGEPRSHAPWRARNAAAMRVSAADLIEHQRASAADHFFARATLGVTGAEYLHQSGPSSGRLDLVLIGDGYTAAQMAQWHTDAAQVAASLLADPLYAANAGKINLLRIDVTSNQSGVSNDITGEHRDTALGGVIGCFQIDRLLCVDDNLVLAAVSQVTTPEQRDFILVVSNTDIYGGSGGVAEAVMSMNQYSAELALHELGHTMFGLADEYANPGEICADPNGEPPKPNATRDTDPGTLKWRAFVAADTALPTPEGAYPVGTVGLFLGGDNCADVYRPTEDSRMRTLGKPWYAVNWQAGQQVFDAYYVSNETNDDALPHARTPQAMCRFVQQPDGEIVCICGAL